MGQYLADIVAAGTENSEDRISSSALEGAACQSTVSFHVPDLGFDGAAPSEELCEHGRDAFAHATDHPSLTLGGGILAEFEG
jgi:hypothetical protein